MLLIIICITVASEKGIYILIFIWLSCKFLNYHVRLNYLYIKILSKHNNQYAKRINREFPD